MHGYIWEQEWCWPYESAWSIMEKFKYANALTNDTFKKVIGLKNSSIEWNITWRLFIYRRSSLNEGDFFKFFQIRDNHFSFLDMFNKNDFTQIFHKEVHYCSSCMKVGYHSYLHQLSFIYSCPFHEEQLLCLRYKDESVPYSIDYTMNNAYCLTQSREKFPAERYIDILPSKKLIDGIWQIAPGNLKVKDSSINKILFFNPSIRPTDRVKSIKGSTLRFINSLYYDKRIKYIPILDITTRASEVEYHKLLSRSKDWFISKFQLFHIAKLEHWFVAMLIDKLIQKIDRDVLKHTISNMQLHSFYYKIDNEEYLKAASAVITAYIVTNARDLYEGIDKSIVFHYYTHNKIRRYNFSITDIESYINSKGIFDKYLPFLIFEHLFDKLYKQVSVELQADINLPFNYSRIELKFSVPDYVITLKDSCYKIYEME